ncbi:hypothetical protein HQ865_06010 [Mucilaginibacter mali]|uniref:Uncharacterized protein n=1 Tax=Mucilaginibacter mali TaxID=2740462 RepID=A0A7D4PST0_9SPHI|nr:hypothetical protein [Mucilaginibacter mali]QKJ29328.1 hypothetical protein HQ865_06010 [Mucilaginibacter mali]
MTVCFSDSKRASGRKRAEQWWPVGGRGISLVLKRRLVGAKQGIKVQPVVQPALLGKGLCGRGSIFAVLNFATFFQEKVVGPCGYEQTNIHESTTDHPMRLPRYRSQMTIPFNVI